MGRTFRSEGEAVPFAGRREAAIDIDLDALPLKSYVAYLPAKPRIELTGGTLTTRLKVVFVDDKSDGTQARSARRCTCRRTRACAPRQLVARRRRSDLGRARPDQRLRPRCSHRIGHRRCAGVDVKRLRDGSLELAAPLFDGAPDTGPRREGAKPLAAATPDKPWSVTVAKAAITHGTLTLADETSAFRSSLADVAVDATNLSTKAGEKAHVTLSFVSADRIATFKAQADVEPLVPAATGTFDLTKFSLGLLFPYYKDVLAVDVQQGSLDLAAHFALLPDGNVKLSEGVATIGGPRACVSGQSPAVLELPEPRRRRRRCRRARANREHRRTAEPATL